MGLLVLCLTGISLSGCAVVSVAATAVNVGVAVGSAAVGVTTTVVKGAVNVGSAVGSAIGDAVVDEEAK